MGHVHVQILRLEIIVGHVHVSELLFHLRLMAGPKTPPQQTEALRPGLRSRGTQAAQAAEELKRMGRPFN